MNFAHPVEVSPQVAGVSVVSRVTADLGTAHGPMPALIEFVPPALSQGLNKGGEVDPPLNNDPLL